MSVVRETERVTSPDPLHDTLTSARFVFALKSATVTEAVLEASELNNVSVNGPLARSESYPDARRPSILLRVIRSARSWSRTSLPFIGIRCSSTLVEMVIIPMMATAIVTSTNENPRAEPCVISDSRGERVYRRYDRNGKDTYCDADNYHEHRLNDG